MISHTSLDNASRGVARRSRKLNSVKCRHLAVQHTLEYLESRQLLTADLTGAFTLTPSTVANGSSQAVTLQVTNDGNTTARGALVVDLYVKPTGADVGGSLLKQVVRVGPLAAGASRNITVSVPFSAALAAGNDQLVAIIDPKNNIADSNQSNNTVTSGSINVTQRDFNLVAGFAKVQANVNTVALGSKTNGTVFVTLHNTGTVASPAGFPINVQVFAQPVGQVGANIPLNRFTVNAPGMIAAGATRTIAVPVQFPATMAAGNFDLMTDVTGTRSLAETNVADNTFTSVTPITVATQNIPQPVVITTFPTPVTQVSPTAGNPSSSVLPTTGISGLLPTTNIGTSVLPTTNLGSSVLPTTNLGVPVLSTTNLSTITPTTDLSTSPSISLVGVTPLNSLGSTPLDSLGNTPLNSIGTTPFNAIGNTPLNTTSITPIDSLGNVSFNDTTTMVI